jgi:hypothetical protein
MWRYLRKSSLQNMRSKKYKCSCEGWFPYAHTCWKSHLAWWCTWNRGYDKRPQGMHTFPTFRSLKSIQEDIMRSRIDCDILIVCLHNGLGFLFSQIADYERQVSYCGTRSCPFLLPLPSRDDDYDDCKASCYKKAYFGDKGHSLSHRWKRRIAGTKKG